jgi:hypothetical protein
MGLRWSHVNWPAIGYVSLESDDGYPEHLARLVTDAPPTVALLANVGWQEARVAAWSVSEDDGANDLSTVRLEVVTRNDEVLDSEHGLWRRWNHGRVALTFHGARLAVRGGRDPEELDLLAGDVRIATGELDHAGIDHDHGEEDRWVLRLLATPTGEATITFASVSVAAEPVPETAYTDLEARPAHGWHGPVPDGWVRFATPVVRSAAEGDLGGLSFALDGADVDELDPRWGIAALHAAAWFDRDELVELLVARGATPDLRDVDDRTPLTLAIDRSALAAAMALVAAGADREARDTDDDTPILRAAFGGRAAIVRALADAGADVTVRGSGGATLLHAAASSNDADTVRAALVTDSVDDAVRDDEGRTALDRARLHHERTAETVLLAAGIRR